MKICLVKKFPYCGLTESIVFSSIFVFAVCNLVPLRVVASANDAFRPILSYQRRIQLIGENATKGIGLVQHLDQSGTWSNVCVEGQILPAVWVGCHQLGYMTGDYDRDFLKRENASSSASDAPIYHVNCDGSEGNLDECWSSLNDPERKQNCTLLRVCCSLNTDVERGVRLISRPGDVFATGLVQVYDASINDWAFISPQKFSALAARLVCSTFGMIVEDTKSESNPTYLTEDERKAPVKVLNCNSSTSSFEDCRLDTVAGRYSNKDFINIACKTYTGCLQPPVFIVPHAEYDLLKTFDVQWVNVIDLEVRTCSGLKLALLSRRQLPLKDFTELDFGTISAIQLRRCVAVGSCVFLETYVHDAAFGCRQWTVIHLELDDDYLAVGIRPKRIMASASAAVESGIFQMLNFSHTFKTTHILPTSTSHTVTFQLIRDSGMNQCFIRSDSGEVGQQCGDAYVHESLCYACGCCFRSQAQPSCYRPIGSELVMSLRCYRTAFQMFGKVYAATTAPAVIGRPIIIAVMMQRITPNVHLTIDFGNDQTMKAETPTEADGTELPSWIAERLDSLYLSGINYLSIVKYTYTDTGRHNAVVIVTDPGIVQPPTNITISIPMDVEPLQPLKQLIGFFYLLNNGPSCAKCTLSMTVLSQGLTEDCITTVDPGDGSQPQVIEMQLRGHNYSEWVIELVKHMNVLIPLETFYSGLLDHSYSTSGQFMAEAIMTEPDRDKSDILSAKTIITVDLRPHLTPIIGTVALFNNGPVYQGNECSLLLVIEHVTPNAKVVITEGSTVLFSHLTPEAGLKLPAWAKDEVIQYPLIGNRTDYLMLQLTYTFFVSGAHVLEAKVWEDEHDDVVTIHTEVIILQLPCDSREPRILGGGGVVIEASLKLKQKDFLRLSIDINLDCDVTGSLIHAWTVSYVEAHVSNNLMGRQVSIPLEATATLYELFIPAFLLDVGYYLFQYKVTIPTNNAQGYILAFNQTWVRITHSPRLSLSRIGILRNVAGLDSTITIDAIRLLNKEESDISATIDGDNFTYTWFCTQEGVSLPDSLLPNDSLSESGGCFGDGLRLQYIDPILVFSTDELIFDQTTLPKKFTFHLIMTQSGEASQHLASHELTVIADYDPAVRIDCFSNCPPNMNMNEELVLEAACHKNCKYGEIITYEWLFNPASTKNAKTKINWETETNGNGGSSLIVNPNVFPREARGESYAFLIIATKSNGLMGSESFPINMPVETGAWMDSSDATMYLFLSSTTTPVWMFTILHIALARIFSAVI